MVIEILFFQILEFFQIKLSRRHLCKQSAGHMTATLPTVLPWRCSGWTETKRCHVPEFDIRCKINESVFLILKCTKGQFHTSNIAIGFQWCHTKTNRFSIRWSYNRLIKLRSTISRITIRALTLHTHIHDRNSIYLKRWTIKVNISSAPHLGGADAKQTERALVINASRAMFVN